MVSSHVMTASLETIQIIIAISGLILLSAAESMHPFFEFFDGSKKKQGIHYLKNLTLGLLNALIVGLVFTGLWLAATSWAQEHSYGLLHLIENYFPAFNSFHRIAVAILLFDLWMYLWHRVNHAIPFLWRFHKVHHSDPNMDVSTATRFHTGEIIFSSVLRIGILVLLGMTLWELFIYEIISILVIQFHHANINLPERIDNFLKLFIVTPSLHKVHHSKWQPETDSNFSTIFSFWDRLFSTYNQEREPEEIQLGLDEYDNEEDQEFAGIIRMPLKK